MRTDDVHIDVDKVIIKNLTITFYKTKMFLPNLPSIKLKLKS